jgi:uncharacterized metal-binding protein
VLFYFVSTRLSGLWSFLFECMTYASVGSIAADLAMQVIPGGLPGAAEAAAVAAGVKTLEKELKTTTESMTKITAKVETGAAPAASEEVML